MQKSSALDVKRIIRGKPLPPIRYNRATEIINCLNGNDFKCNVNM